MSEAVVVVDGVTYRGDASTHTIAPTDDLSALALRLLGTGEPLNPGVDELSGVVGSWDQYPQSMVAAFLEIAAHDGLDVTWFSDQGTEPPQADPRA